MTIKLLSTNSALVGGVLGTARNHRNVRNTVSVPVVHVPQIHKVGKRLNEALRPFTSGQWATFPPMITSSTNPKVANVKIDHTVPRAGYVSQSFKINVKQLAQPQVNQGYALASTGRAVETGGFSINISHAGRTHEFNIQVNAGDTNETIQQRLAEAINAANIGVHAKVTTGGNATEPTSKITLFSAKSGVKSAFQVTDTRGNLAETIGIRQIRKPAQNAIFTSGSRVREFQTNTISIGTGTTLNLKGVGETRISIDPDVDRAKSMITEIINSINAGLNLRANLNGVSNEARLVRNIRGALQTFSSDLARVGIHVRRNGDIRIDENALRRSIKSGSIGDVFRSGSPLVNRLQRIADQAMNATAPQMQSHRVNIRL